MSNVTMYDGFYQEDPYDDWYLSIMLVDSSYIFDPTHASIASDIAPNETTGSGYVRLAGITMNNQGGGTPPEADIGLFDTNLSVVGCTFVSMTTTDWRYVVGFTGDVPMWCADAGSLQTLTAESLAITGLVLTFTGP